MTSLPPATSLAHLTFLTSALLTRSPGSAGWSPLPTCLACPLQLGAYITQEGTL